MGRKYTYTLNDHVCIDSLNAGNPSRFINHSARPNCYAKSELRGSLLMPKSLTTLQLLLSTENNELVYSHVGVFHEHHEYADRPNCTLVDDLEEGAELFLDYGEDFFLEIYDHKCSKLPLQN